MTEKGNEPLDPWFLTLTVSAKPSDITTGPWLCTVSTSPDRPLAARGPIHKAEVIVDGVRVQALLDHGAQVSLVRKELLPKI